MTTTAALVTVTATRTSEHLPANRLAVAPAVFARLCRESPIPIALDEELIGVNHPREKERLLRELRPLRSATIAVNGVTVTYPPAITHDQRALIDAITANTARH